MILYPAIDLKDGKCVRLVRGDMEQCTVFNEDPVAQAKLFEAQGFKWLHLVDLDGAFAGHSANSVAVSAILNAVKIPIQLGGGIRNMKTIEYWLSLGVARVILGTVAVQNPMLVHDASTYFPRQIAVGIDARNGKVAIEGWAKDSGVDATELALRYEDAGVSAIIYTDIHRDGALEGPNIDEISALATRLTTPVIASGGISSVDDLHAIKMHEDSGIAGIICGRALYDGRIDVKKALHLMAA